MSWLTRDLSETNIGRGIGNALPLISAVIFLFSGVKGIVTQKAIAMGKGAFHEYSGVSAQLLGGAYLCVAGTVPWYFFFLRRPRLGYWFFRRIPVVIGTVGFIVFVSAAIYVETT